MTELTIFYKIILNEKNEVIEYEIKSIDACCLEMEEAIEDEILEPKNDEIGDDAYKNSYELHIAFNKTDSDGLYTEYYKINFCPFCGAPIVYKIFQKLKRLKRIEKAVTRTGKEIEITEIYYEEVE